MNETKVEKEYCLLQVNNKHGKIADVKVSKEDEYLRQFSFNLSIYGYPIFKNTSLHRYIAERMGLNIEDKNYVVDHIDRDKLNCCRSNLRLLSKSDNSRNRSKSESATSKFFGVYYNKRDNKYIVRYNSVTQNKLLRLLFDNEIHAGWQYNLWVIEDCKEDVHPLNDVELPHDFAVIEPKTKTNDLPEGISLRENGTSYRLTKGSKKTFKTFELAQEALKQFEEENQLNFELEKQEILNTPPLRNIDGDCIIEMFDKNKIKVGETIVDEDIYYKIKVNKYPVSLEKRNNYAQIWVNKTKYRLHRWISDIKDKEIVDHINNNRLDNRQENLRCVTSQQNSFNTSKRKNTSSKFLGVSYNIQKKVWCAFISFNGKSIYLGSSKDEIECAKIRDKATLKYFGIHGKLNFPEETI